MLSGVQIAPAFREVAEFVASELGQAAFEYVLVIGVVAVALVVALMGLNQAVEILTGYACPSVDTAKAFSATVGSCIG